MKYLTFDIESCTGNPYDGSLCSFGYILAENGEKLGAGDILCNPLPKRFTLGCFGKEPSLKLAYPVSTFRREPRFNARYREIQGLFEKADLVLCFAGSNDLKYLNNACDSFSLPRFTFRFLDVQLTAGLVIPELKNHGLKAAASRFGIDYLEHRSDEDARVTYEVFEKTLEVFGGDLDALIKKFGIEYGANGPRGHINCFAIKDIEEKLSGLSKSVRKNIVASCASIAAGTVTPRGEKLFGKAVCLFEDVYVSCVSTAKKAAFTIYREGGRYESSIMSCDILVCSDKAAAAERFKRYRRLKIMDIEEFTALCGGLSDCPVSDKDALIAHYSALVPDTETEK